MEIEGEGVSDKHYARSDEFDAMLTKFGNSDDTMDTSFRTALPRSYYTDGLTNNPVEHPAQHVFDPNLQPARSSFRLRMAEAVKRLSDTGKKVVHINSVPNVQIVDYSYDRTTAWGGENPEHSQECRVGMVEEVLALRQELFPEGCAFGDRDVDLRDPSVARTSCARVHVVETKEEKMDGDEWPTDDFY